MSFRCLPKKHTHAVGDVFWIHVSTHLVSSRLDVGRDVRLGDSRVPGRVRVRLVRRGVRRVSGEHGQGWVGVAVVVARKFDPDGPRVQPVGHDVPVDRRDYMRRAF